MQDSELDWLQQLLLEDLVQHFLSPVFLKRVLKMMDETLDAGHGGVDVEIVDDDDIAGFRIARVQIWGKSSPWTATVTYSGQRMEFTVPELEYWIHRFTQDEGST